MPFQIPDDYSWVIASVGFYTFASYTGSFGVGAARSKVFKNNAELWKKKTVVEYAEAHKKAIPGGEIDKQGYPDMGNGLIAHELEYADWLAINNAQRVHYKYVEEAGVLVPCIMATGLIFPRTAAVLGAVNTVGALIWGHFYAKKGSKGRYAGGLGMVRPLSGLVIMLTTIYAGLSKAGAFAAIQALIPK